MFKRYPSIINHYRTKDQLWWTSRFPELMDCKFVVTEKIHGANFQFVFKPNGEVQYCSRNQILSPDSDFYGFQEILKSSLVKEFIKRMKIAAGFNNETYRFYGELFGANVQKGVNYGPEKQVRLFDYSADGVFQSFENLYALACAYNLVDLIVPVIGYAQGIMEVIEFDTEFDSVFTPGDRRSSPNLVEGVVAKPYSKVIFVEEDGSVFSIKKKNEAFKEIQKTPKPKVDLRPEVLELRNKFMDCINDQRLQGIFSKNGEIEKASQIGQYIKLMTADVMEEFIGMHGDEFGALGKKEQAAVTKCGAREVALLLKGYL